MYRYLYNNVVSSLVVAGDLLEDTHIDDVKSTSADLALSFSMPQTSRNIFNKPFEFLLYKTNRLHFAVRACVL